MKRRSAGLRELWIGTLALVLVAVPAGPLHAFQAPESLESPEGDLEPPAEDWLFDDEAGADLDADPLEPGNRVFFAINERLYAWLLDPVADAYGWVTPDPVRNAVRRFFRNLQETSVLVNDLLRGDGRRAASTGARFAINSSVGVAGLFDPASCWGIAGHEADFGETLAIYGVGAGPYVVLPLLGPSTARDAFGEVVDSVLRLDTWLLAVGPRFLLSSGDGITAYETQRLQLEELRRSSLDFYTALRSAYRMDREARIRSLRELRSHPEEESLASP